MMCIHMTFSKKKNHSTHSTQLFKIFFSLLTLSTAFLQKASGPGKNWCIVSSLILPQLHHRLNDIYNNYPHNFHIYECLYNIFYM